MSTYSSDFDLLDTGVDVARSSVEGIIRLWVTDDTPTAYLSVEEARRVAQSILQRCDELERNPL